MPPLHSAQQELTELARRACHDAVKAGAAEARATAERQRFTSLEYRDRRVDTLEESTAKGLRLTLYIDGRYSNHSTSDLRHDALRSFVAESVAMTRHLTADPHRSLPDPEYYEGRRDDDLDLADAGYARVDPAERHRFARAIEEAALAAGGDRIISTTASYVDARAQIAMVASNGFEGFVERTLFLGSAEATARDAGDRRPEDYWSEGCRHRGALSDPATIGRRAAERALRRVGADKIPTGELPIIVENRASRRLLGFFGAALRARNLQQRRSFLEGKLGEQIASPEVTVIDDPFIPRARGSRLYDDEGIAARRLPIVERGVLRNFYVDTYYGKKLGMAPTTGSMSNVVLDPGVREPQSPAAWMRELGRGILVTGFIGGNSNSATGDFSTGIQGLLFEGGELGRPVTGLNIAGNHLELWHRLMGIGDDPYPFNAVRSPSLVFDRMLVAGV